MLIELTDNLLIASIVQNSIHFLLFNSSKLTINIKVELWWLFTMKKLCMRIHKKKTLTYKEIIILNRTEKYELFEKVEIEI